MRWPPWKRSPHGGSSADEELPYLLFTPGGADQGRAPLILFLHGRGETGESQAELDKLKQVALPKLAVQEQLPSLSDTEGFPFMILCPQTAQKGDWSADIGRVESLLDVMVVKHGVDPARRYVTGVSQGAIGAWELAAAAPTKIAAIAPVSWKLPTAARRATKTPCWVIVGGGDPHYDAPAVGPALHAMRPNDDRSRFSCVPDGKHDDRFWSTVYANPDLYRWLLRYSAPPPAP